MALPDTTSADDWDDELDGDPRGEPEGRRHEVLGVLAVSATVLMTLALLSHDPGGENWVGAVGAGLASVLLRAFGYAAWIIPIELGLLAPRLFRRTRTVLGLATLASTFVFGLTGCALVHLTLSGSEILAGGVLGEVLGEVLRSLFGTVGAYVVGITVVLVTALLRAPMSLTEIARRTVALGHRAWSGVRTACTSLFEAWREARALEAAGDDDLEDDPNGPKIVFDEEAAGASDTVPGTVFRPDDEDDEAEVDSEEEEEEEAQMAPAPRGKKKAAGPRIVAPIPRAETKKRQGPPVPEGPFLLPPTRLLQKPPATEHRIDPKVLRENAALLVEKLEAYGVRGKVDEIHPGPVVTMYEFEPQSGTKVSKIAGLADDLAMALAAQRVRIVAPIPGKARVGFELPNDIRKTVYLREILEDDRWDAHEAALPMAFGQDIAGQAVYGDLAKMPHLLVAGATGAGKSVGLNVMLTSLLSRRTPEEVRLLMIDPKVVELAVFDGIPHMLLPVVTDMKKAALSLRWAVDEMERRYQLFADAGTRNIGSYNSKVRKVLDGELAPEKLSPKRANKVRAQGPDGEEVLLAPVDGEAPDALDKPPEKLPYVVVVVDEFADLMMVAAKDVESAIARLAQKARAAGIHVILATQRPSVDVITGMIKANFPARIAFKVSQREDSKTILGRSGAEHLLGMGDMLLLPPGASDLKRVHSAFVGEDDVREVCDFLRAQGKPVYDEEILKPREESEGDSTGESSDDPLYDKAVAAVAQAGFCSISQVQRRLSVGYNKAAKLVDRMEAEGVVGPSSSKAGGRREVLIQSL